MAARKWKWFVPIILVLAWVQSTSAQSLERFTFAEPHLGTIVEFTLYATEETVANEAARAGFHRIKELDRIFSDYKNDSEAMRLCETAGSGQSIHVSRELFQVLKQALAISEQTNGQFDVTVGPLIKLWRKARKEKKLPTDDAIRAAKELVGWKLVILNESEQTVQLQKARMQLDFGGIAKGFIAQEVSQLMKERGVRQTLIAVAGDIVAGEPPPRASGWKVGVAPLDQSKTNSSRLLLLKNCAISTSGDAFQFVEIAGVRYSHIVDPATGLGLTRRSSVTILAPNGATADAWATAVCILGPDRGLKLLETTASIEALIVQATEDGVRVVESRNFGQHEIK